MGKTIDGKALAASIRQTLKTRADTYRERTGRSPGLGVVLVGDDAASAVYVRNKEQACNDVGICSRVIHLPKDASEDDVLAVVQRLNDDEEMDGIIVQLPLPQHIDSSRVVASIDPSKDVDGLHPLNTGRLRLHQGGITPCTPRAVLELLDSVGVDVAGRHVVIVGRSTLVGKPLAALMLLRDATVTVCHSRTEKLKDICQTADVIVSAAGHPGLITSEHVTPGTVVIDVGTTWVNDRLCGDVDYENVKDKVSWITPVPGGVGPMTVTMLLANTLDACES